jgi:hypothetical protein
MNPVHARMIELIALVDKACAERARRGAFCYGHRAWMRPIQSPRGTYYIHEMPSGAVCYSTTLPNP